MNKSNPFEKIFNLESFLELREQWRLNGERLVFTNGVFDLIHPGHCIYLQEAKNLGTKLIVGLNSDASVKQLNKGDSRPINPEDARAIVLSAFDSVDAVVLFSDATPLELIKSVAPEVLVKGGDYSIDQIVGAKEVLASGGEVKQLSFVEGYSTTAIEQKIKAAG